MSKVPRMVLISIACILTPIEAFVVPAGTSLFSALVLIVLGCIATIWNRARAAYLYLEGRSDV